jgi:serine/threonine protein kinase
MDEEQKASFLKEKEILKIADHPFLIEYIEDFEYRNEDYCIVTKYASGHNLTTLIQ